MQALTPQRAAAVPIDWGETEAPDWVQELRRRGAAQFEARGYPTVHDEDWKYTDVTPIARGTFKRDLMATDGVLEAARLRCIDLGLNTPRRRK